MIFQSERFIDHSSFKQWTTVVKGEMTARAKICVPLAPHVSPIVHGFMALIGWTLSPWNEFNDAIFDTPMQFMGVGSTSALWTSLALSIAMDGDSALEQIKPFIFRGCALRKLSIPMLVTSFAESSFAECPLRKMKISRTVATLNKSRLGNCPQLTKVEFARDSRLCVTGTHALRTAVF
jgi:hypothetical protein